LVLDILASMNEEKVRRFKELFDSEATKAAGRLDTHLSLRS
jgi:hypothetical protein